MADIALIVFAILVSIVLKDVAVHYWNMHLINKRFDAALKRMTDWEICKRKFDVEIGDDVPYRTMRWDADFETWTVIEERGDMVDCPAIGWKGAFDKQIILYTCHKKAVHKYPVNNWTIHHFA